MEWRLRGRCRNLSPEQSDKLFFPSSGGKTKKAKQFCANCPVISQCLIFAIENNVKGFWAGTTDDERAVMGELRGILMKDLGILPDPVKKRRVYRKVPKDEVVHASYLDELDPTEPELQALEVAN